MLDSTVLIVGAGPTGLALACDLRSRGISTLVVEKLREPPTTTRALGVQPRGRQILGRLGVLKDLNAEAVPQGDVDIFVEGQRSVQLRFDAFREESNEGVLRVPQTAIERMLRQRLEQLGAEVLFGWEIVQASDSGMEVTAIFRSADGEKKLIAEWLVGCDGAHSTCRKIMNVDFEGSAFPTTFLLADVRLDWVKKEGAAIYLRKGQVLTLGSLASGMWRVGVALPADDPIAKYGEGVMTADRTRNSVSLEDGLKRLQELFAAYSGDSVTKLHDPTWCSIFRIHRRMASAFRRGRMLIAGDAAHLSSPLGGQGMNSGLGDSFNLGWKLAMVVHGLASEQLIDTYEGERRPATAKIEHATTTWTNVLLGIGPLNKFLRRYIALPLMRLSVIQRWVLTSRQSLQSSYRGGPLARTGRSALVTRPLHRGPQPGDLAPDIECIRAKDATPTRIGEEVGICWGLLIFGPSDDRAKELMFAARNRLSPDLRVLRALSLNETAPSSSEEILVLDTRGALKRIYKSVPGTAILIRPDGYVGWRSKTCDVKSMLKWLDSSLLPPKTVLQTVVGTFAQ
ncbi:MAG: FAD-dependent monooxygenase [Acidobacteria bacterium]|nr:FAD-dependent monooxygenase [Acidobacteriota bacterium]